MEEKRRVGQPKSNDFAAGSSPPYRQWPGPLPLLLFRVWCPVAGGLPKPIQAKVSGVSCKLGVYRRWRWPAYRSTWP